MPQAPDFTLDHVLGHEVSLGDHEGQTVVVYAEAVDNHVAALEA